MVVKLLEFVNICFMVILIFLIDVVVFVVVFGILWNMVGVKEEMCVKFCLFCVDNEMKICCECYVFIFKRFLIEVYLYVYVVEDVKKLFNVNL